MATSHPTNLTDEARAFLAAHRIAHLATVNKQTIAPHVIPLCFVCVENRLYFVVDDKPKQPGRTLQRLRNIETCARVALVVDDYDEDWSRLAYLLVHGDATRVTAVEEYGVALVGLRQRYQQYQQMPLAFATHPMVRIDIRRWHLWRAAPQP